MLLRPFGANQTVASIVGRCAWLFLLTCLGCERTSSSVEPKKTPEPKAATSENNSPSFSKSDASVEDIGTRKAGVDWPQFLGPTQDGKSTERGILKPWPKTGPRIVWTRKLGTGYSAPVVSKGRLFQFSRFADKARLTCMKK